jgi:hypothetical protein
MRCSCRGMSRRQTAPSDPSRREQTHAPQDQEHHTQQERCLAAAQTATRGEVRWWRWWGLRWQGWGIPVLAGGSKRDGGNPSLTLRACSSSRALRSRSSSARGSGRDGEEGSPDCWPSESASISCCDSASVLAGTVEDEDKMA